MAVSPTVLKALTYAYQHPFFYGRMFEIAAKVSIKAITIFCFLSVSIFKTSTAVFLDLLGFSELSVSVSSVQFLPGIRASFTTLRFLAEDMHSLPGLSGARVYHYISDAAMLLIPSLWSNMPAATPTDSANHANPGSQR